MKPFILRLILSFLVPFFIAYFVQAQEYDLVIKQGHLIDPKNEINEIMDIAIADGKVAKVSSSLTDYKAKMVIEAKGMYVIPGIIDIHTHTFFGTEYADAIWSMFFVDTRARMTTEFRCAITIKLTTCF